jgi:hypothetical protein
MTRARVLQEVRQMRFEEKWPHSFEQPAELFKWSLC